MFDKACFDQKIFDLQEVASKVAFQIDAFQNDAFQSVIFKILEGILASTGALGKMTSRIVGQGYISFAGTLQAIRSVLVSLVGTLPLPHQGRVPLLPGGSGGWIYHPVVCFNRRSTIF